jgi:GxxExxY protein
MIDSQYKHSEISAKVIGAAMKVHNALGNGFQEVIYQRALAIELEEAGIGFQREVEMPIYYREKNIGTRRVDFLVENELLVELKAISFIETTHHSQLLNYIIAYHLEVGLLINFGGEKLELKRMYNTTHPYKTNKTINQPNNQ